VEGEGGEEVGIAGAESRVFVRFVLLFVRKGLDDGVRVVVPRGGEGVDGAEVDQEGASGVEVRKGDVAGALGAGREGDFLLTGDPKGTEDIGECVTNTVVAFSEVVGRATHQMVPERVHGAPTHGAGVKGITGIEGDAEPPTEGGSVMSGGEDVGDAVVRDGEHPSGGEGLGLEAQATFVAGGRGSVEGVGETSVEGRGPPPLGTVGRFRGWKGVGEAEVGSDPCWERTKRRVNRVTEAEGSGKEVWR
jgi:hypothetical protein